MSIKTGTATDYFNLLTILRDFLVNTGHTWNLQQTGTGNGRLTGGIGKSASVVQTITCTATSSTNFTVSGSVTGSMGSATVGTLFTHAQCDFTITAGGTAFVAGDTFTFNLSPKWTSLRFGGCGDPALRTCSVAGAAAMFDSSFAANAINTTSASLPIDITVQMQAAIEVKAFSLWAGDTNTLVPSAFSIEYSDNGSAWTTHQSWSSQTWSAAFARNDYVLSSSAGSHVYWRVRLTAGAATIRLAELQMFADTAFKWACSHTFEFIWRGPGVDGAQQIFVMGTTSINSGTGYYNWVFRAARFLPDADLAVANIANLSSTHAHLLSNSSIPYWLIAHGGRFIVLTRISGVYEMSYLGFGLPYETPTNHPYPMMIGAPSNNITRLVSYSSTNGYRNPWDPSVLGLEVMIPSGLWREVRNGEDAAPPDGSFTSIPIGKVWPWMYQTNGQYEIASVMRDAVDGTRPILPAVVLCAADNHAWGEFDGVSWVSGFGNTAEALTQIGAIDYINFPNVFRSGNQHFAAIALD